jgi:hypothetical protein
MYETLSMKHTWSLSEGEMMYIIVHKYGLKCAKLKIKGLPGLSKLRLLLSLIMGTFHTELCRKVNRVLKVVSSWRSKTAMLRGLYTL